MIVTHSGENHNYLVQTRKFTTHWRQSQLPGTDIWLYHTAGTITTT